MSNRPNILFLMTDHTNAQALAPRSQCLTPNLDNLTSEGIRHWKYVFSPGGIDELYNLAEDPYERVNLADVPEHRETLMGMAKRMWRKMKAIGDNSLFNTHYATLRTAPIGPKSIAEE